MWRRLRRRWCKWFHGAVSRPFPDGRGGAFYRCWTCLEEWPVEWAGPPADRPAPAECAAARLALVKEG